jgi:hypothetical protein
MIVSLVCLNEVKMQNKQSALIFFASVLPKGISRKRQSERIIDYSRSLEIVCQYAARLDFDIYVVENTLESLQSWVDSNLYIDEEINFRFLSTNSGTTNKGIGELDMALSTANSLLTKNYEKVIWFSGRHLLTSEGILSCFLNSPAEVVVSNPDFYFLNGNKVLSEKKGLLNDMLFGMSLNTFQKYMSFFSERRTQLIEHNIGSEQLLYQFVLTNKPTIEEITHLGVLRRENRIKWRWFETSEWHFC